MITNANVIAVQKRNTKNIILEVSLEMFAERGFNAVSLRDIANVVGIKMASLYYYYKRKELLIEDILRIYVEEYKYNLNWLSMENEKATTLEEVIRNIFDDRIISTNNPYSCFGMALVNREQHCNECARNYMFEVFQEYSVNLLKSNFDSLIIKGLIPPSDTNTIASLLVFCLLEINDTRVHEYMGAKQPKNSNELYNDLKHQLAFLLKHGFTVN